MKFQRAWLSIESRDRAELVGHCVEINGVNDDDILLYFPDRTPRDKLEAIAKAINDALDAAREIEGAARD